MKEILQEKVQTPESSLIEFMVYDFDSEILQVKYKRGKRKGQVRTYKRISNKEYGWIMKSSSKGRALLTVLTQHRNEEVGVMSFFRRLLGSNADIY
ncbi:KTSC domain-containing protein [Limibacter armeniacum]|uniref:KTSC domain-containing protein n=1 Tax=Limibacter armeniacum TaxID=466084 RepID=UPI002FE5CF22